MEPGSSQLGTAFLAALAVLAFFFIPSTFLNDEVSQGLALDGLAHGHIWTTGGAPGYAPYVTPGEVFGGGNFTPDPVKYGHWAVPAPGTKGPPVGSMMEAVLALPLLGVLMALAQAVGPRLAISIPLAAAAAWGSWRLAGAGGLPTWIQRAAVVAAAASFWPMGAAWPMQPTLEFAAGIFVSMAATALAAAFLFDLVRGWLATGAAVLAAGFLLATPVLFWAGTTKYSALSTLLVVMALWCYREGFRTPPLETTLAFSFVGLAVWNQMPFGIMLGFALGVVALGVLSLGRRATVRHGGAAAAGFAVGMVPFVLTAILLHEAHLVNAQIAPTNGDVHGWWQSQFAAGGLLSFSVLADPTGPPHAAVSAFAWTTWTEVKFALSMPAVAPLCGVALAALARPSLRGGLPRFVAPFNLVYILAVFLMMGRQFSNIGAGPDMRYGLTFWPLLAILAAPTLASMVERHGLHWCLRLAGFGALGLLLVTIAANWSVHEAHHNLTSHGIMFDQTAILRFGGTALAALLAVIFLLPNRWRVPLRDHAVLVALGVGGGAELLLVPLMRAGGPWAAWPMALLSQFFQYILFRHWPQYGI